MAPKNEMKHVFAPTGESYKLHAIYYVNKVLLNIF